MQCRVYYIILHHARRKTTDEPARRGSLGRIPEPAPKRRAAHRGETGESRALGKLQYT